MWQVLAKAEVVPGNSTHKANETMLRGVFQLHDYDDLSDAYLYAETIQPGMFSSMNYLYRDSEKWDSLRTLLWHNK